MKKFFEEPVVELIRLETIEATTGSIDSDLGGPSVDQGFDDEW